MDVPFDEWVQQRDVQGKHQCIQRYARTLIDIGTTWDTFGGLRTSDDVVRDFVDSGIPLLAARDIEVIAWNALGEVSRVPLAIFWDMDSIPAVNDKPQVAAKLLKDRLSSYGRLEQFCAYTARNSDKDDPALSPLQRTNLRLAGCQLIESLAFEESGIESDSSVNTLSVDKLILVDATRFVCDYHPTRAAICIVAGEPCLRSYAYMASMVEKMKITGLRHRVFFASNTMSDWEINGVTCLQLDFAEPIPRYGMIVDRPDEEAPQNLENDEEHLQGENTMPHLVDEERDAPTVTVVDKHDPEVSALSSSETVASEMGSRKNDTETDHPKEEASLQVNNIEDPLRSHDSQSIPPSESTDQDEEEISSKPESFNEPEILTTTSSHSSKSANDDIDLHNDPDAKAILWAFNRCKLRIVNEFVLRSSFNCELFGHRRKKFPDIKSIDNLISSGIKKGIVAEYGTDAWKMIGLITNKELPKRSLIIVLPKEKSLHGDNWILKYEVGCTPAKRIIYFPDCRMIDLRSNFWPSKTIIHIPIERISKPVVKEPCTPLVEEKSDDELLKWAFDISLPRIAGEFVPTMNFIMSLHYRKKKDFPTTIALVNVLITRGISKGIISVYGDSPFQLIGMKSHEKSPRNALAIFVFQENIGVPVNSPILRFHAGYVQDWDIFFFPDRSEAEEIIGDSDILKSGHLVPIQHD